MRNQTRDSKTASNVAEISPEVSIIYKICVCIKGSCTICSEVDLYNFYGMLLPQLCARSFDLKNRRKTEGGACQGHPNIESTDSLVPLYTQIYSLDMWY